MAEPLALETWLGQEEGFSWILPARQSPDSGERQRAGRALEALDKNLRRILAHGTGRGWVRHRKVDYLLLVWRARDGLRVMTLARSVSWLDVPAAAPRPAAPASSDPPPLPQVRHSPGH